MLRREHARVALAIALVPMLLVGVASPVSLAAFSSAARVATNTFSAGFWTNALYLHNTPAGDTNATTNMPMDGTAPNAAALGHYSLDCETGASHPALGRIIGGDNMTLTQCLSVAWQTTLLGGRSIVGGVVVDFWSGVGLKSSDNPPFELGQPGSITVVLADVTAGRELGRATLADANWQHGSTSWVHTPITIAGVNYPVPAGDTVRLTMSGTSTGKNMRVAVAYNTTAFPATLRLP